MAHRLKKFNLSSIRGVTLIELLIYMSIFSIMLTGFMGSTFYIQKIIQSHTYVYKTKLCIYQQLYIIQKYLGHPKSVEVNDKNLIVANNNNKVSFSLTSTGNFEIEYFYPKYEKKIQQCDQTNFSNILFMKNKYPKTASEKFIIQFVIEFMDMRKKTHRIDEYLTTPNLAPITIF